MLKEAALAAGDFCLGTEGDVFVSFRDDLERLAITAGRLAKSTEVPVRRQRRIGDAIGVVVECGVAA